MRNYILPLLFLITLSFKGFGATKNDTLYLMNYVLIDSTTHKVKGLDSYCMYSFTFQKNEDTVRLIFRFFQPTFSRLFCGLQLNNSYTLSLIKLKDLAIKENILNSEYYRAFRDSTLIKRTHRKRKKFSTYGVDYCEVNEDANFYTIVFIDPCNPEYERMQHY